jgi:chorismate mutase/prephenate dehydratase
VKADKLKKLREDLARKDREIVRALNERATLSVKIGEWKRSRKLDIYDPAQESRVMASVRGMNEGPLPDSSLGGIYKEIFSFSRALQEKMSVAFLGPEGSYSHMAALSHFGGSIRLVPQGSIPEVFDAVERRQSRMGIVPVENSLEGSVKATLDRLITTPLQIRAETFLRISHCLVSSGKALKKIEKVYSHPQAIAQCRQWLKINLPGVPLFEVASTAAAARKASLEKGSAAIASRLAAKHYGLKIAAGEIEDHHLNTTRFAIIGEGKTGESGRDKTSILMGSAHVPGALHRALEPFVAQGLNLLRIESYPMRERNWEYLFFLDVEGHANGRKIAECLRRMEKVTTFIKILGSYPRGEEP